MRIVLFLASAALGFAAERTVDPTFLRRNISAVAPAPVYIATDTCEYKPLFGEGDRVTSIVRGVSRFGELTVKPGGKCKDALFAAEEEIYVVTEGKGTLRYAGEPSPVRKDDFLYLPASVPHTLLNENTAPLRLFVMGFKVPPGTPPPDKLMIANLDEVKKQTVGGHPDSVLYQLMMGDTKSKRDRLASAHTMVSLYVMEFAPGGTNFPHHHDSEEEIYVLLDGAGDMVAGSGLDGIEARHASKPGDAYFFRLNCTVGFYNSKNAPAHILAVRSTYPRRN